MLERGGSRGVIHRYEDYRFFNVRTADDIRAGISGALQNGREPLSLGPDRITWLDPDRPSQPAAGSSR